MAKRKQEATKAEAHFDATPYEMRQVRKIVARAQALGLVRGAAASDHWYTRVTAEMDIRAAHANGTPLNLDKFLAFDDFNFTHDIAGIARHMDRTTGQLGGFFRPRCARPASEAA
jgi:hypothetical protein